MRGWIVLGAAVALAACNNDNQADDNEDFNQGLTAQNIVANDVTAIDAVTGDAANMAADVDFTDELANDLGPADGNAATTRPRRQAAPTKSAPARSEPRPATPAPAAEPASNATE